MENRRSQSFALTAVGLLAFIAAGCETESTDGHALDGNDPGAAEVDGGVGASGGGIGGGEDAGSGGPGVGAPDGGSGDGGGGGPGKGTGGSTATCSPACTPGAGVTRQVVADDGAGMMRTFSYQLVRPNGLTNSPTNKAPLLVDVFGDTTAAWGAQQRFVWIFIPQQFPCPAMNPGNCGYSTRSINPNAANIAIMNQCGANGNGPCDMSHYVKAMLDDVIAKENIDTNKIFVTGASKGGYATLNMLCDPITSPYFRGGVPISANVIGAKVPGAGTANLGNSPLMCPTKNRDFSVKFIHGTTDGSVVDMAKVVDWPDGNSSWFYDQHQDIVNGFVPLLGCSSTATKSGGTNVTETWSCPTQFRALELDTVTGGGHTCNAMDGVNGYDCRSAIWNFLTSH
jgi:poly(3-hydroxybutyrate) depolymerase